MAAIWAITLAPARITFSTGEMRLLSSIYFICGFAYAATKSQ